MKIQFCFCLLFVFNFICRSFSLTLEQIIMDSVERGLKSLTQLKRQLPEDGMDEDSRELMSFVDKDYILRDDGPDPLPTPVRREVATSQKDKIENKNCSCYRQQQVEQIEASAKNPRFLGALNRIVEHAIGKKNITTVSTQTATPRPTLTTPTVSKVQLLSDSLMELQDLELQLEAATKEACPYYKTVPELDVDSMADIWQLAFYKAQEALSCFKIFIKKTSPQSRKRYKIKYTSFNETIAWQECYLELRPTGKRLMNMRHFLQGSNKDKGVLENIVLVPTIDGDKEIITLLDQAPDQWLVTKNLLLMRDCDSGDVVIFTRILTKPDTKELVNAMNTFGENGMNGTIPCRPENVEGISREKDAYQKKYYNMLS